MKRRGSLTSIDSHNNGSAPEYDLVVRTRPDASHTENENARISAIEDSVLGKGWLSIEGDKTIHDCSIDAVTSRISDRCQDE